MAKTRKNSGRKHMSRKLRKIHKGTHRYKHRGGQELTIRTPISSSGTEFLTALTNFLNKCIDGTEGRIGCKASKNVRYHLDLRKLEYPEEQILQDIEVLKKAIGSKQNSVKNKTRKLLGKETRKETVLRFLNSIQAYYVDEYEFNENANDFLFVEPLQIIPGNEPLPSGKTYPQVMCDELQMIRDIFVPLQNSLRRGSNSPLSSPATPSPVTPSPPPRSSHSKIRNLLGKAPSSA